MSRLRTKRARRVEIVCIAALSVAISRQAIGQEQSQTQQPPLPPVTVQPPPHRPTHTARKTSTGQRAKPKRVRRVVRRPAPANGARAAAAAAAAQEAAAAPTPANGSTAAGYRVDTVTNVGPFSNMSIQDTPYSYTVLSSDFIENTESYATPSGTSVLDKDPLFGVTYTDQRGVVTLGSERGINNTSPNNFFLIDGLPGPNSSATLGLEPYDRIEILSGVPGFLYGVSPNLGAINYVLKEPTAAPFYSLTLADPDGENGYLHLDAGATSKDKTFGYRLNIVGQDGDTNMPYQSTQRDLVSGVFDYRPFEGMLLQLDAIHSQYHETGTPAVWFDVAGVQFPSSVPNTSKLWGEPYGWIDTSANTIGPKMTWQATSWLTIRSAFQYSEQDYSELEPLNYLEKNNTYEARLDLSPPEQQNTYAGYTYADLKFDTGVLQHKLTVGWSGNVTNTYLPPTNNVYSPYVTGLTFNSPTYIFPEPDLSPSGGASYEENQTLFQTYSAGDNIEINKYFSALLGGSYAEVGNDTYATTGSLTSGYHSSKATPTYALLFHPVSWVTLYGSYIEGLEQGEVVNDPNATNDHAVLPPYLRKQYEAGIKATVNNNILLTADYFDINSALQYSVNNGNGTDTYVQSGRQDSKGVEFTATGKITDRLRVLGGFMFADARVIDDQADPAYDGTRPQVAPQSLVKLTAEYDLPFFPDLTITGGAYHTGGVYYDQANTIWVPGHTTFDAGLRYTTKVDGHQLIGRLYVSNLTNVSYWAGDAVLGDPRRVSFSLQTIF